MLVNVKIFAILEIIFFNKKWSILYWCRYR